MKHTTKLGPSHYIRLDSYGESRENRRFNVICTIAVLVISAMTAGAMAGIDITNLNPQLNHETTRSSDR